MCIQELFRFGSVLGFWFLGKLFDGDDFFFLVSVCEKKSDINNRERQKESIMRELFQRRPESIIRQGGRAGLINGS